AGKKEQITRVPDAASSTAHSKKQRKLVKLFKGIFSKKGMLRRYIHLHVPLD
ncbi:hypothetical protein ACJMK2_000016, partial [Sinanodonta woodiana]